MLTEQDVRNFILDNIEGKKPSREVLLDYRKRHHVVQSKRVSSENISSIKAGTVVFISDRPNYFFLRVSDALRAHNIDTVLITRWGVDQEHASFFSDVLVFDSLLDLYLLNCARDIKIYVQSWVGWFFLPVFVRLITNSEVFCNINDSSMLLFDELDSFSRIGIDEECAGIDLQCERYIYDNFELVTHPYQALEKLIPLCERNTVKYFPCHPLKRFTKCDRSIYPGKASLVFVGGIPYDEKDDAVFKDAKIQGVVHTIVKQKVDITILNNPMLANGIVDFVEKYRYFSDLSLDRKNFIFKPGLPPWELGGAAKDFTYGMMIYDFDDILISKRHIESIVPTKFFTYMEMCMPVIVVDEMKSVAKIVHENNLGIVLSYDQLDQLEGIIALNSGKYESFKESVLDFNSQNNMDLMVESILDFFD